MSKAYKCDACRSCFDSIDSYEKEGSTLSGSIIKATLGKHWYPNSVDLCPKCAEPLKEFMSNWWKEIFIG